MQENPKGPEKGDYKVIRNRVSLRFWSLTYLGDEDLGFRVVLGVSNVKYKL